MRPRNDQPVIEETTRPRAFTLELTKGCNLRCGYCYYAQRDDAYDSTTRMTEEVAEQAVEILLMEGPPDQPVHLHFFGGEPLLAFPLMVHTVHYARRRGREEGRAVTFEVTTNGTRFTDEVIAFLNEHEVHVGVSFDGPPAIQDVARPAGRGSSHALAEPGIRNLLDTRRATPLAAKTHCSVVLTRLGFDLSGIIAHLEDLGFQKILLTPATDLAGETNGFREEDLPRLLAEYETLAARYEDAVRSDRPFAPRFFPSLMERLLSGERRTSFCGGGRDYLGVVADGKVNLCYRFYENGDFAMGSVQTGIDRGVTERLDRHALDERTTCSRCWARWFCGGGCHHENVTVGGGLGEPNPVTCEVFRHGMGRTFDSWARLSAEGKLPRRTPPASSGTESKVHGRRCELPTNGPPGRGARMPPPRRQRRGRRLRPDHARAQRAQRDGSIPVRPLRWQAHGGGHAERAPGALRCDRGRPAPGPPRDPGRPAFEGPDLLSRRGSLLALPPIELLGIPVRIACSDREQRDILARCYGRSVCPSTPEALKVQLVREPDGWRVAVEGRPEQRAADPVAAVRHLNHELLHAVMRRAPQLYYVHAAVVTLDGKGVVLPGVSQAGKSTLALAAVLAGAGFLSDELLAWDPAARLARAFRARSRSAAPASSTFRPWPTPSWGTGEGRILPFDALRPNTVVADSAIDAVVVPEWNPGARRSST